jgi:membrane dipeptidase
MNEIGILVDTGHCTSQTLMDAVETSSKPIACSHAGMRSRAPKNPRTQTDEALKALADKGGVFGIVSTPGAINDTPKCTAADYVDTIEAAVNLISIDHVAFGTDLILPASIEEIFTAPEWGPKAAASVGVAGDTIWPWSDGHKGMENNSGYPNLTRGLVAKGYSDQDIAKIMGGNFVRLIEETIG